MSEVHLSAPARRDWARKVALLGAAGLLEGADLEALAEHCRSGSLRSREVEPHDPRGPRRLVAELLIQATRQVGTDPPAPRGEAAHRVVVLRDWYSRTSADLLWLLSPRAEVACEQLGHDVTRLRRGLRDRGLLRDPWSRLSSSARSLVGARPPIHADPARDAALVAFLRGLDR